MTSRKFVVCWLVSVVMFSPRSLKARVRVCLHYSCQFKKMPLVLGRKTFNFKKPKETAKQTLRLIQHLPACNSKRLAVIQLIVNNKILSVSCLMIA